MLYPIQPPLYLFTEGEVHLVLFIVDILKKLTEKSSYQKIIFKSTRSVMQLAYQLQLVAE